MQTVPFVSATDLKYRCPMLRIEDATAITDDSGLSLPFEPVYSGFKVFNLLTLTFALISHLNVCRGKFMMRILFHYRFFFNKRKAREKENKDQDFSFVGSSEKPFGMS